MDGNGACRSFLKRVSRFSAMPVGIFPRMQDFYTLTAPLLQSCPAAGS